MRLSEVHIFIGWKSFYSVEKIPKHYSKIIFAYKQKKKGIFRTKSMVSPLWKICKNATIWSAYFYRLEIIFFYQKDPQKLF